MAQEKVPNTAFKSSMTNIHKNKVYLFDIHLLNDIKKTLKNK